MGRMSAAPRNHGLTAKFALITRSKLGFRAVLPDASIKKSYLNKNNVKGLRIQSQEQSPRILDQVHNVLCLHLNSIHAERTPIDWIKRYIYFHRMKSRDDLEAGERKIETFLTHLPVDEHWRPPLRIRR